MCISVEQHGHWHSPAGIGFLVVLQKSRLVDVACQRCWRTADTECFRLTESTCMGCRTSKPLPPPSFAGRNMRTLPVHFTDPWRGSSYSTPPFKLRLHLPRSDNERYLEKHWQNFWSGNSCACFVLSGNQNIPVNLAQYPGMSIKHTTELLGYIAELVRSDTYYWRAVTEMRFFIRV